MEIEVLRGLSWEGDHGDIQGLAMKVGVLRGLSWEGGHEDIQGEAMEVEVLGDCHGKEAMGIYRRRLWK